MKIDRLIGIIAVLQQQKKVTAPYLAQKFEVSRRTITRDIEAICKAGIPIVTAQGADGGISIMEGFRLNTTVFTKAELQALLIGIQSIDSVSQNPQGKQILSKLGDGGLSLADHILIDLSSHYKDSLAQKIALLQDAISNRILVRFHYYYNKGEADKLLEPYLLVFKWSDWYLFGFCRERQDFRLYKLNRLWDLTDTGEKYGPSEIPAECLDFDSRITDEYKITAVFHVSQKYRLIEEYSPRCFQESEEGLLFQCGFLSEERAVQWLLPFGDKAEVLQPESLRQRLLEEAEKIAERYR